METLMISVSVVLAVVFGSAFLYIRWANGRKRQVVVTGSGKVNDFRLINARQGTASACRSRITKMETDEDGTTTLDPGVGYMDDNSNICKSDPDERVPETSDVISDLRSGQPDAEGRPHAYDVVDDVTNCRDEFSTPEVTATGGCRRISERVDAKTAPLADEEGFSLPSEDEDVVEEVGRRRVTLEAVRSRLARARNRDAVLLEKFDRVECTKCARTVCRQDDDDEKFKGQLFAAVNEDKQLSADVVNNGEDHERNGHIDSSGGGGDVGVGSPIHSDSRMASRADRCASSDRSSTSGSLPDVTWHACLYCFRDRMATMGVTSRSFDDFLATAPMTLRKPCSAHAALPAARLPAASVCGTGSDHHRKSVDDADVPPSPPPGGSNCDNAVAASAAVDDDRKTANSPEPEATGSRDDVSASPDVAVVAVAVDMLREFGKRLDFEREQRQRADDWADFLLLELDAHIDARTEAEVRREALRERTMTLAAKYRRLKSEHASLLSQIREMSMSDSVDQINRDVSDTPSSSLLRRRKRPSPCRGRSATKRNAVLFMTSGRRVSSSNSDSSEDGTTQTSDQRRSGHVAKNLAEVRQKWQSQLKKSTRDVKKDEAADLDESLESLHDQNEFVVSPSPTTSTPLKPSTKVAEVRRSSPDGSSVSKVKVEEDGGAALVNVKASTTMWERLLQKNSQAGDVTSGSSKTESTRQKEAEELGGCWPPSTLENARESDGTAPRRGSGGLLASVDSDVDVDDVSDLEYLSANEELVKSDDVLTDSIDAKRTRQMWESLSSSTTTNGSPESTRSPINLSPSGLIEQARAKFETIHDCSNQNPSLPETAVKRSTDFSTLKSKWEQKGRGQPDDRS